MNDYLQGLLDAAFPAETDAELSRAVQQGILLADSVLKSEKWLDGAFGLDARGYLRRAGIQSQVNAACVAGDLPFAATVDRMPRGPFHWVELTSNGLKAHICRTDSPNAFPEDTPTRQDERLANPQGDLFESNVVPIRDVVKAVPQLFAWLSFGIPHGGQLGHLCWAMPDHKGEAWLAHTNVLHRLAVAQVRAEPEAPPERVKIRFKEEIAESLNTPENAANENRED